MQFVRRGTEEGQELDSTKSVTFAPLAIDSILIYNNIITMQGEVRYGS